MIYKDMKESEGMYVKHCKNGEFRELNKGRDSSGLAGRGDMETMAKPLIGVCPCVGGNAADVSAIQMLCILIYVVRFGGHRSIQRYIFRRSMTIWSCFFATGNCFNRSGFRSLRFRSYPYCF